MGAEFEPDGVHPLLLVTSSLTVYKTRCQSLPRVVLEYFLLIALGTNDKVLTGGGFRVPCVGGSCGLANAGGSQPSPRLKALGSGGGGYFGCWPDPANAASEEPLQRDWEEGVNQLLYCHYKQVEKDSQKVVVTSAIA